MEGLVMGMDLISFVWCVCIYIYREREREHQGQTSYITALGSRLRTVRPAVLNHFWHQGLVLWKTVFLPTGEGGWLGDDSSVLHLLCTLFLLLLHQLHLRSSGFRSQRLGTPALDHTTYRPLHETAGKSLTASVSTSVKWYRHACM